MMKDDIQFFLNKNATVSMTNGYYYTGKILQINDDNLVLLDRKIGKMIIRFDSIVSVMEKFGREF